MDGIARFLGRDCYGQNQFISAPAIAGAMALLSGETQGFAIDATTPPGTVSVKDTTTPANNFFNLPLNTSTLVQAGTSPKVVMWSDGFLRTIAAGQIAQAYDPISGKFGIFVEKQGLNFCLQSDDLTDAVWTKSNMSTAKTAVGPDNISNSATTLTASAANATALQAITSTNNNRCTSVWIKRRTGSGNIDLTQDNGGTWTTQSVTSLWTRFALAFVVSANPTVGIRIVTSGDAVDVWGFQHETSQYITSNMPTLGSQGTRNEDNISVATSTMPSLLSGLSVIAFVTLPQFVNNRAIFQIGDTTSNSTMEFYQGAGPSMNLFDTDDAGNVQASFVLANYTLGIPFKVAGRWLVNDFNGAVNGVLSSTPDTSGVIPANITTLNLGRVGSVQDNSFLIHQFIVLPRRLSDAELQSKTT